MKSKSFFRGSPFLCAGLLLCAASVFSPEAKTRWSALHFIPDADLLQGGQFVFDAEGYFTHDSAGKSLVKPGGFVTLGIVEWVNLEAGYCGAPTIGFKARILGETGGWMPSLAIGAHNILGSKEAGLFASKDSGVTNEFYLALGKSIEPLKMRLHLGLESIPQSHTEQANPYFGIEEYFGAGLYASLEVFRRRQQFHPSLFLSYRIFKRQLELSAGAVDLAKMFFDENNQFKVSLGPKTNSEFVKPGIWFGLRYSFVMGFGRSDGFNSVDDKVAAQGKAIRQLSMQVDSLRRYAIDAQRRAADVSRKLAMLSDSMSTDKNRLKPLLLEKIVALKNLYAEEPFEPERVKRAIEEIVALREDALPPLRELLTDKKTDKRVRVLCISLLGDIGNAGASDILLDVLSQTQDPEIKIEILISLGKMKETRAEYVLEQLANDPIDEVAFTAQQVLRKLSKETGMKVSPDAKMRKIATLDSNVIPDVKIKTKPQADSAGAAKPAGTAALNAVAGPPRPETADTSRTVRAGASPAAESGKAQRSRSEDVWGVGDSTKARTGLAPAAAVVPATAKKDSIAVKDTTSVKKPANKNAGAKKPAAPQPKPQAAPVSAEDKNW
jgi:hypothetical protein